LGARIRTAVREEKGWKYLVDVVAGERTNEDLVTWLTEAAVAPSSQTRRERERERAREMGGLGGERTRAAGSR
jgi:hypothetical protein